MLLLLADAAGALPSGLSSLQARAAYAASPTITIVSPQPPQGPAGTKLTVSGHNFSPPSVTLNANANADCSVADATLADVPVNTSGDFTGVTITWPNSLGPGTYYVCAAGVNPGPAFTQTAPVTPPSLTLDSPTNARGPVGTHVTLSGSNFQGGQVTISAASDASCQNIAGQLATFAVTNGSFSHQRFVWPLSLGTNVWYICGSGMTSTTIAFQILSQSPPTIALDSTHVNAGDTLSVTGSNFIGPPSGSRIIMLLQVGNRSIPLKDATLGGDGTFTYSVTLDNTVPDGNATLTAQTPPENNADAALQATASLDVGQAPTPTTTVAATATANAGGGTSSQTKDNGSPVILLVVLGIVLVLLLGLGGAAFFLLRKPGEPGPGGYGSFGGFGGSSSPYGQPPATGPTEAMGQGGQFGRSGSYDAPSRFGAVGMWDETEASTPAPGWQPRPMTGHRPYESTPGAYPPDDATLPPQGNAGPVDPWAGSSGSQSGPGTTRGAGGWGDWERTTRPGE